MMLRKAHGFPLEAMGRTSVADKSSRKQTACPKEISVNLEEVKTVSWRWFFRHETLLALNDGLCLLSYFIPVTLITLWSTIGGREGCDTMTGGRK
jgi:hypothetical protein